MTLDEAIDVKAEVAMLVTSGHTQCQSCNKLEAEADKVINDHGLMMYCETEILDDEIKVIVWSADCNTSVVN